MSSPDMLCKLILSSKSPGSLVLAACHWAMVLPGSVLVFKHVASEVILAFYGHGTDRAGSAAIVSGRGISRIHVGSRRTVRVAD